jgi:fumarylacetoacetate (FAA) hydrolase
MKLASLRGGGRDGRLIVVDKGLQWMIPVPEIASSLRAALEDWPNVVGPLRAVYNRLNQHKGTRIALDMNELAAPLPRSFQVLDGSAYLTHVERVRKARGAELPPSFLTDPLMYQGHSADCVSPCAPIIADESWGIDFEAEVAVITDDVPRGIAPESAEQYIRFVMLMNDISLRELIPAELAKGFGFLHGKPGAAYSPVAVTPDEFGSAWSGGKLHRPLITRWNDTLFGDPDAGVDMQFNFPMLIAHAAKTRRLAAGTIIGSGTVSNADRSRGCSCIVECRVLEIVESGKATTQYLKHGDRVRIEMFDSAGQSIFGAIDQKVQACPS